MQKASLQVQRYAEFLIMKKVLNFILPETTIYFFNFKFNNKKNVACFINTCEI